MGERSGDLTGQRFGRLMVAELVSRNKSGERYLCHCDCGGEKLVFAHNLQRGRTKSCGCLQREQRKRKGGNTDKRYTTLCVSCIRSAAPPELQCIWDASRARELPQGVVAEHVEKKSEGGTEYTYVISCPEYLSIHDGKNQARLKEARKKNNLFLALERAETLGCIEDGTLPSELAREL